MRIFITSLIILLLSISTSVAQSYDDPCFVSLGIEPARQPIVPFDGVFNADDSEMASPYMRRMNADWTMTNDNGVVQYTSRFSMPTSWLNRHILLRIEAMTSAYEVTVNGSRAGYTQSGATLTEFNITKFVKEGRNDVTVTMVANAAASSFRSKQPERAPRAMVVSQPPICIRDVVTRTSAPNGGYADAEFAVVLKCRTLNPKRARIRYTLHMDTTTLAMGYREMTLDMRREDTVRFSARIPATYLWNRTSPTMLQLDLDSRIDGRKAEYVSLEVGLRAVEIINGSMYVNGSPQQLRIADYDASRTIDSQREYGVNCLRITDGDAPDSIYTECDRRGMYVIARSALDTSSHGQSICRGGNPTNVPAYRQTFISRSEECYHSHKHHPCVIGFMIGHGVTNGCNIYDAYRHLKSLEPDRPIIYDGAGGEWCTDRVKM